MRRAVRPFQVFNYRGDTVVLSLKFKMPFIASTATAQMLQSRANPEAQPHTAPFPVTRMPASEQRRMICWIRMKISFISFSLYPPFQNL